jgi:CRISPR-associated endonuclease/helicase Cas3
MADSLGHLWAKSPRPGDQTGQSLVAHTTEVVQRLAGWRKRHPRLGDLCERTDIWTIAGWAALLHDLGKTANGFQAMLRGGAAFDHRHEVLSMAFIGLLFVEEETRGLLAAAVVTHHKDLDDILAGYPANGRGRGQLLEDLDAQSSQAVLDWLQTQASGCLEAVGLPCLPPLQPGSLSDGMARSFKALAMHAQAIDEGDARAPVARAAMAARGLLVLADHAGSAGVSVTDTPQLATVGSTTALLKATFGMELMPHQERSGVADGNVLLTAPTGSGKTEAALLWWSRQREQTGAPLPLFYILPYRASLNAMYQRFLDRYQLDREQVALQHANATAAIYQYLVSAESYEGKSAEKTARYRRDLGRLMTAPVRLLTPYQLVRGFFGLKGHEAIITDASEGCLVLDELHAYDRQRLGLILASLRCLVRELGARVFAMSATFPTVLKQVLHDTLGGELPEIAADAATQAAFRRHRLTVMEDDLLGEAAASTIQARVRAGEAVLVVATTVARAQQMYGNLAGRLGADVVSLLHSRFTGQDRARKEAKLADEVGTGRRSAGRQGLVLVATQVVEVSLDIDFDVLFTDPAPVEALIQRFGRVNRGRRGGERDVFVFAQSDRPQRVYDPQIVERAMSTLRGFATRGARIVEEEDLQGWVDTCYAPLADAFIAQAHADIARITETVIAVNRPLTSDPALRERFFEDFDGREVVPASLRAEYERRLSEEPLTAGFLHVPISNGQYFRLRRAGRVDGDVVELPYDDSLGLNLTLPDTQP